jgi:large subunit ribosomal protein L3
MANQSVGLLGRKIGMTQIFDAKGDVCPVTIIDASGNAVVAHRTSAGKDGYDAVQLGLGERKATRTSKGLKGVFDKAQLSPRQIVREVRVSAADLGRYQIGAELAVSAFFTEGNKVDVTATSKGKGFAGVMKKHNFKGFIRSHGTHEYFRHGGSIGTRLTPGMTLKGKKMPGQMGNARVTVQNLVIVKVDADRGLVYLRGGVPGPTGGLVTLRDAVK